MAGQKAAVERGQGEFQVVGVKAPSFLHRARTGAGAQANVPHALNDRADRVFGAGFDFVVGKGEEHIDVRVREEILAPIATQRQQSHIRRGLVGKGSTPHFNEDTVHDGGAAANGGSAVARSFAGLADQRHLPRILLPKIVNRQSDWIHVHSCLRCVACRSKKGLLTA